MVIMIFSAIIIVIVVVKFSGQVALGFAVPAGGAIGVVQYELPTPDYGFSRRLTRRFRGLALHFPFLEIQL